MGRIKKSVKTNLELQVGGALSYLNDLKTCDWDIWLCDKLNKFKWPYAKLSAKAKKNSRKVDMAFDKAEDAFNLCIRMNGGTGCFGWVGSVVHWNPFRKMLTIRDTDDSSHYAKYSLKGLSQEELLDLAFSIVRYSKEQEKSNE